MVFRREQTNRYKNGHVLVWNQPSLDTNEQNQCPESNLILVLINFY